MGLFNIKKKEQTLDLNGYIIDTVRGLLIKAPVNLSTYNIPPVVKEISLIALNNMKESAVEINFSNNTNINTLPFGAFSGFKKLAKVVFPQSLKKMDYYFDNNTLSNGVEIVLPKGLEQFVCNHFSPNTVRLELDDSLTTIKGGIVSHNNVLEELIISGNIKKLEKYSVNQVKFLEKIWLKEGIIVMDDEAIRGCNNLREVHIPESLRTFKLGRDDFRPVIGYAFNCKGYIPTKKKVEKEQNRTIKLYKMINGTEIIFEVNRSQFKSMTDTGRDLVFFGYDNSQYRVLKEEIINHKFIEVDIIARKMLIHNIDKQTGNQQHSKTILNTEADKKNTIEKLLKLQICNTKRIKDQTTGTLKIVLKTQQELSSDMVSILEELEEDYIIEQLDSKTINEYRRYIQMTFKELISNAPFKETIVEDKNINSQENEFYKKKNK